MALKQIIKDQTIIIDDHKRGCQDIKEWTDKNDIHIDKKTNFKYHGRLQNIRIRIPINSERDISIENKNIGIIPKGLQDEIKYAFENKQIRSDFISDIIDVLNNYKSTLTTAEKVKQTLKRISKHFDLNWKEESIKEYIKEAISYKFTFESSDGKEYMASMDEDKIIIGQNNGINKQYNNLSPYHQD